ncbi:hypothetical protein ACGFS9_02720 [Streptomyces sp. NPDC048566]|uniref:hypothetical protein n=1 Tax=Streptomyces sp. NPDC048566 TaxID=3365569 RepID=UPI00371C3970
MSHCADRPPAAGRRPGERPGAPGEQAAPARAPRDTGIPAGRPLQGYADPAADGPAASAAAADRVRAAFRTRVGLAAGAAPLPVTV